MNAHSRFLLIFLLGLLGLGVESALAETRDKYCGVRSVGVHQESEVCHLPLVRLLAAPQEYRGKVVRVTGFVVKHNDVYALFESRGSFLGSAGEAGIPLLGDGIPETIKEAAVTERGASRVTVIGRFDYGPHPSIKGSPGTIREISVAYYAVFLRDDKSDK